jgi:hypothetical protein
MHWLIRQLSIQTGKDMCTRLSFALFAITFAGCAQEVKHFRPPAVPLVAHDPYFSIWSNTDHLNDAGTVHWTGKPNTLTALARIDLMTYQVMGRERTQIQSLPQVAVEVLPTRSIFTFAGAGVKLVLTFLTPALPDDLDVLSRPLTYLDWEIVSTDGASHEVAIYFDAGSDLVVNTPEQAVSWARYQLEGESVLRMGSRDQAVLAKRGDNLRIDWGYVYLAGDLAGDHKGGDSFAGGMHQDAVRAFQSTGKLMDSDDFSDRISPSDLSISASIEFGHVGSKPVRRYLMLAYDDEYAIEYFQRKERPWWRRNGAGAADLIRLARNEHDSLLARSVAFDTQLMADLRRAGGERYAFLAALAYRQTLAAQKLVADADGTAMYFPKENFSNGCISTVDVIYPSSPFTLLFNPKLLQAQLQPVLDYARMPRWPWPFAPHDLGTYPQANGQVYGGGERTEENQMPVEESGNMLIMLAALAHVERNADYAARYWPEITRWAEYLREKGLDPANQLSTDDFAGHLAHNANLSIKAIVALGAYGILCERTGHKKDAALYSQIAHDFAGKWVDLAAEGDHYKLAFDQPGTWSQKYNLVWDKLLDLNLFPAEIARTEIAFSKRHLNPYGLPLDNRKTYTKLDWEAWTATLAENPSDFQLLIAPAYEFANDTPNRVPLSDWYDTKTGAREAFQARSVVGGLFIKMLADPEIWKRYADRALGTSSAGNTAAGQQHGSPP